MATGNLRDDGEEANDMMNPQREIPTVGRIIHLSAKLPDGTATPCRAAIVSGFASDEPELMFATEVAPSLAPMQITIHVESKKWHWPER